jgi:DNA polymerase
VIDREWEHWMLDCEINQRGVPIDRTLVMNGIAAYEKNMESLYARAKRLTRLNNPNSVTQLLSWLDQRGVQSDTLDKLAVRDLLLTELPDDVRELLEVRQQMSMTSIKKLYALRDATSEDGRLRNTLQFYGASRTGRWAGRLFQPQNIPRGSLKGAELYATVERIRAGGDATMDELQSVLRCCIRAPGGKRLVVADLANIESRILGWVADEPTMLKVFRDGRDIYKDYGESLLRKAYGAITTPERNYCKPPALGCGYGLGAKGLIKYADGMGVEMNFDQSQAAVEAFRNRYSAVPVLWRDLESASMRVIREGGQCRVGRVTFRSDDPWLFLDLPSGRSLAYLLPQIEMREAPWGEDVPTVTYMGVNQYTRKWERLTTYGGKWVENICQAISRDVLAEGLQEAEATGFECVLHTHDEIVSLVDDDDWLDETALSECMATAPSWADDKLYLGAEGFSDVIYRK